MFFLGLITVSCDEDIISVGAEALVDSDLDVVQSSDYTVLLEQVSVDKPQSNNLEHNLLGSSALGGLEENGVESYDILSQFFSTTISYDDSYELSDDDSSSTEVNYVLKSAQLVIPYNYSLLSEESDHDVFTVNSDINTNSLSFNVYKSDYQLQTVDYNNSSTLTTENYYADGSDGEVVFNEALIKSTLYAEDFPVTLPSESESFDVYYTNDDGEAYGDEELSLQFEAIKIDLNQDFIDDFNSVIISDVSTDLDGDGEGGDLSLDVLNDDSIYDLFKGIYIEALSDSNSGYVQVNGSNNFYVTPGIQLNFEKTTIETTYNSEDVPSEDITVEEGYYSTFQLSENPINIINKDLFENSNEDRILLKSGRGSLGKLSLLSEEQLLSLFDSNILLNEALLQFTVDQSFYEDNDSFDIEDLPSNIFISSLEDGSVLTDFSSNYISDSDFSQILSNHLYTLQEIDGEYVYQINITSHIAAILSSDNESDLIDSNNSLALSVTNDLGLTGFSEVYDAIYDQYINQGSLLCNSIVPLCSSNHEDETKRPKLTLTYTQTQN